MIHGLSTVVGQPADSLVCAVCEVNNRSGYQNLEVPRNWGPLMQVLAAARAIDRI